MKAQLFHPAILLLQVFSIVDLSYRHYLANQISLMQGSANTQQKPLEKLWNSLPDRPIQKQKSQKTQYKINRNQFLGRGGFGIVYGGIRKVLNSQDKYQYEEVAIKEFKRSEKWRDDEDKDKELIILSTYKLDQKQVLKVFQEFKDQSSKRYYLITRLAKGGALSDRLRGGKDAKIEEQDVYKISLRLAGILKYLHYDALSKFQPKNRKEEQNQRVGIIHRDVKPQNIVFLTNDTLQLYLIDFGIAKIGYTELLKGYNNCGTAFYRAPEIGEGLTYNAKVDIYSFGCTLYQILSDGQRLLTSVGVGTIKNDRERFVKSRLLDLQLALEKAEKEKSKKIKNTVGYWMHILNKCLAYQIKNRWSSEELLDFLQTYPNLGPIPILQGAVLMVTQKDRQYRMRREIFQANFQIFRLSMIQNTILLIFQHVYFKQPRISQFTLYVLLKFISLYFYNRHLRLKERIKQLSDRIQKIAHLRTTIDSKILQLREKAHGKVQKEIEKERTSDVMQNKKDIGPNQEMVQRYPDLLLKECSDPKRILIEFIYQKKTELLENQMFTRYILTIVSFMEDIDFYEEMRVERTQLENTEVQVLSVRGQHSLKKKIDERLIKDLRSRIEECKIENSIRSHINREENKADLDIIEKTPKKVDT